MPNLPEPVHGWKDVQDSELWAGDEVCTSEDVWKSQVSLAAASRSGTAQTVPRVWAGEAGAGTGDGVHPAECAQAKERFRVSEHPFGTIKFYDGAHYFLCKGKEMVAAETSLMFTSYNIRRAITLAGGVQNLIARMHALQQESINQGISMPI